jgi:hypothetical protein
VAVPVDHLVDQLRVVGMDLIRQIGAGEVLHRPVVPPHPVWEMGPAPGHQMPAREPQTTSPTRAVTDLPLAPVPGEFAERRVAVHQIRKGGGDTLRQTLHELHLRGGHKLGARHGEPQCQGSAMPSNRFPVSPIATDNGAVSYVDACGGVTH